MSSMGIRQDIEGDYHAALAALAWQLDLGADEAIGEAPISAYDLPEKALWQQRAATAAAPAASAKKPQPTAPQAAQSTKAADQGAALERAIAAAAHLAAQCETLAQLDAAAASFDACPLGKLARGAVGSLGHEGAAVMVICDPPSMDTEKAGRALGQAEFRLFEQIFAAIGLSIGPENDPENGARALLVSPALPWPLRGAGQDQAAALAMMRPFAARRMVLVAPKVVVVMGHFALNMVLGEQSISRVRGVWQKVDGINALPMLPPRSLLQTPSAKREAWADALALKAALKAQV
jgi:DNA polymerase